MTEDQDNRKRQEIAKNYILKQIKKSLKNPIKLEDEIIKRHPKPGNVYLPFAPKNNLNQDLLTAPVMEAMQAELEKLDAGRVHGGEASKKRDGIIQAIQDHLQDRPSGSASSIARNLWLIFKRKYSSNPYITGEYEILFEAEATSSDELSGRLTQDGNGNPKSIQYDRFYKHVRALLNKN
jgi:hypothetical protein